LKSIHSIFFLFAALLLGISVFPGCKKQTLITSGDARLDFSVDTLKFDTVFTTIGSSTRFFKIHNLHNQSIRISSVTLAGGEPSNFRMNVDGLPGIAFKDLEIAAKDSMYVFVEVTVDPGISNNPFLIMDSVVFVTNGNMQAVKLSAYGQNAHFHDNVEICNETWTDDKPHVILGSILVDTNCTLTIEEGVRVFVHDRANIFVAGTLIINGTKDSVVTFQGDRLEPFFDDLPGQWGNIVLLRGSKNNRITHADISEAVSGIVIGSTTSSDLNDFNQANLPDITIKQTEIRNCRDYGIFSFYSNVTAENTLIHSVGKNNVALLFGGEHVFTHCTIVNYGVIGLEHKLPAFKTTNYAIQNLTEIHLRDGDVKVHNSIIYGNILVDTSKTAGEVAVDTIMGPTNFNYVFDACLLRTNIPPNPPEFLNVITNADPDFTDISESDFSLGENSPARGSANPAFLLIEDLYGNFRNGVPDMGAIKAE
jgi:hypothetical protein